MITMLEDLKFVTVGDPHVKDCCISNRGNERLTKIVSLINTLHDIDFVIFLGDIVQNGTIAEFRIAKGILSKLKYPYLCVAGNHDKIETGNFDRFESYFNPTKIIEDIKGYQICVASFALDANKWDFNWNSVLLDKDKPTLFFAHMPVIPRPDDKAPPPECWRTWSDAGIQTELNKFTKLIGVYTGHVHWQAHKIVNNAHHIIEAALYLAKICDPLFTLQVTDTIGVSYVYNLPLFRRLLIYQNLNYTSRGLYLYDAIDPLTARGLALGGIIYGLSKYRMR